MKITIAISVAETGNGKGRSNAHEARQEFTVPGALPWNAGSLAAEMLRAAIQAYEERSLLESATPNFTVDIADGANLPTNLDELPFIEEQE